MYLKRLEIQGFKSFAGKTEIDFQGGITGVVGPNGSGKSNISDALRWVLGEQSAKTLRGSKMEDIIFSGTNKRRPLGFAEVTLVLDNSDGQLPVDYSEVCVTRRVFRSGESEYYINKTSCRLKDIRELFMDTGVGKDGYSIIGQGKIDEILSTKSEDRRNIFEEAAGIVKYKTRKEEGEKKLEKTKDNLTRIKDIISELESQVGPLEIQSEKAKEFLSLSQELKSLEVNLYIREIDRIKEQYEHIASQKDVILEQIQFNEEKRDSLENKYNQVKHEIDKMDKNIDDIQNLKLTTQSSLEKKEGELNVSQEKAIFLQKETLRLEKEILEKNEKILQIQEQLKAIEESQEELVVMIDKLKEDLDNKSANMQELVSCIESKERTIEEKKTDIIQLLNSIADIKSKINSISSFNQTIDRRIIQIDKDKNEIVSRLQENSNSIDVLSKDITYKQNEVKNLKTIKQSKIDERKDINLRGQNLQQELDILRGKIQGKVSKYSLLKEMKGEYEGFYKSVKSALLASRNDTVLGSGVRGVVAELIKVDKKHEKAIEVALGSSLQNIVTETEEVAKRIINYLKKNNLGRVTFLPLSSITGRGLSNSEKSLLNSPGLIGIASNLISFDSSYQGIFEYLLGRVLIVESIDDGIKIAKASKHTLKIVSLEGDVLNPGGSMTGGSYNNTTNLLGRERQIEELEIQIEDCKKDEVDLIGQLKDLKSRIYSLDEDVISIDNQLNSLAVKLATTESTYSERVEEGKRTNALLNKCNQEKEQLEMEKVDSLDRMASLEKELKSLSNENSLTQSNVDDMIKSFDSEKTFRNNLEQEITEIRVNLASYQQELKSLLDKKNSLENTISYWEKELGQQKCNLDKCAKEENEIKKIIEEFNIEKSHLNSLLLDYEVRFKEIKNDKNNFMQAFYLEQEKLKDMNRKINDLQKSLNTLDVKYAKYSSQLELFNSKLWDDYELTYQMAVKYKQEIESIAKVQGSIKEIKEKIKSLGNINVESIDEYQRVKERYEFMQEQKEDLISAKDSLTQVIKDMEIKMREQFIENFNIIKGHFSVVFQKLFGGGKADVFLEDEENILTSGIEIIAQPPGKKLQNLSLLSGGERALTAIALLFAILKTKPTPFCILDEIEAALDDANVYRYADYLKEFSNNTQFIAITHRKGTMESVDSLYGVTMEEEGVSKLVSVKLSDNLSEKAS